MPFFTVASATRWQESISRTLWNNKGMTNCNFFVSSKNNKLIHLLAEHLLIWTTPFWFHFLTPPGIIPEVAFKDQHANTDVVCLHSLLLSTAILCLLFFLCSLNFLFTLHKRNNKNIHGRCHFNEKNSREL